MKKLITTLCLGAAITSSSAWATSSIFLSVEGLQTDVPGDFLPETGSVFLVADTDNDSFGNGGLFSAISGFGNFLDGDDDLILWRSTGGLDLFAGGIVSAIFNIEIGPLLNAGDALALVWFPELAEGSTNLVSGMNYGIFTGFASSYWYGEEWVAPVDGWSGYPLTALSEDLYAGEPDTVAGADLVADKRITERSSSGKPVPDSGSNLVFAGLAATGLLAARRKFQKR